MKHLTIIFALALSFVSFNVFAGTVNRAQFTSSISDREPIDQLVSIPEGLQKTNYFTELVDFQGQTVIHQWMYKNKEMYRMGFEVKGPRWRVWSSKRLLPKWHGTWTVNILDNNQKIIHSDSFIYMP